MAQVTEFLVAKTRNYIRKGCKAYLAHVVDTRQVNPSVRDIPTVCYFSDVFLEEMPGLPPDLDVEFSIKVMSGTAPILMQPYRMAST